MSNRTAFFMAIIGTLHPVPAAATGVVPVGSATFSGTSNTGSSSTDGSAHCDLPAGCMVGDTAVLTCNALVLRNFTWVAPDGAAVVLAATTYGTLRSAVYAVKLVQADIDAGTVSAPFTALAGSSVPSTVEADVYRGIDSAPIDVVGSTVTGTFPNTHASETVTIPGITTRDAGELVQYAIFTKQPQGFISSAPPMGWTPGASQDSVNGEPALTGYTVQATPGPTGSIAVAVSTSLSYMSGAYVGMLFSLRAYNPTFRLTGTLPNATVGTAWTGVLTFAGDFTGTITIDASAGTIPAWMGTPVIDYTAKTATWSGTPTTAKTESFTPRATSTGGQIAVGPAQSVVIAASGFSDDFSNPTASAANWSATLQGTAGGAYAFNTGSAVLTPAASQKNSVALRHTGTFKNAAMTASRAANPGTLDYLSLSLGTGNVTTYNNDNSSWQITTIQYGYSLVIRAPGNMTLYRCNGSGANTTLATKTYTDSTPNAAHVYQLVANGSGVAVTRDGVTLITSADTTYATGGDILIAQGEYTSGVGGIATLTQVTAS